MTESYNNVEEPFVFQDNVVVVDNTPSPPTYIRKINSGVEVVVDNTPSPPTDYG